jgi:DNA-binding GntR family transcriptional regulator
MKQKRSDQLREAIEEKIAMGEFPPGKRLDEIELLKSFGVSRTPLREALIQLTSLGLIEIRPRKGAFVAEIGPQRLYEMFEVMAGFEAMCARMASRRLTDEDRSNLLVAHKACKAAADAGDPDSYYYANEQFHFAIYAASHNSYLAEQARQLHRKLRVYRRLQLRVRGRIGVSYAEHDAVLDALLGGQGELAAQRVRAHVLVQGQRFGDLIASLATLAA